MKPRILQNGRFTPQGEKKLAADFDLVGLWQQPDPADFLKHRGGEFVGLVTTGPAGASASLIDSLPALRVIATRGVGFDKIDVEAAQNRGIHISNTPDVLTDCVADLAIGALIAVVRGLCSADRFVRRGDWEEQRFPLTTRVSGKKMGIVGMGRIGRAVAMRARCFSMEVRYHSRQVVPGLDCQYESAVLDLARWSDFLVVCVPGGPNTVKLISREVLAALGSNGYLINIARGSVVDERELIEALSARAIGGAALDVFEKEPHVPNELRHLDNVVLLPHIASSTVETFEEMESLVIRNLHSYFETGRLLTPIS